MSTGKVSRKVEKMLIDKIRCALEDRVLNVVAARAGVSVRTLRNLRSGRVEPNQATLKVLADYLGVKEDE